MARAKKTDRAEARRRARAAATVDGAASPSGTGTSTTSTAARIGSSSVPPTARPGIVSQFRAAIRPIDLRQDLRDLPWLVTRTPAVALPSLLVVVSAIWYGASGGSLRDLPGIVFNLFVFPPPLAAAFLAGILTQRMSYLAGGIVGIVSFLVFAIYLLVGPVPGGISSEQLTQYILYGLVVSPVAGFAIGGFAGFYRRFLRVTNPNRGGRGKNQKAPARR